MPEHRKLTAIMFTDVVGSTALMGADETNARSLLDKNRDLHRALITQLRGELLEEIGDGTLSVFASAVDAVKCAAAIHDATKDIVGLKLRIAIHIGDVVRSEGHIYGDGVNVASRIHALAEPGGIVITEPVQLAVRGQADLRITDLGEKRLKNIDQPVRLYGLASGAKPESALQNVLRGLVARRMPHVLGVYAVAVLIVVAFLGWLVERYGWAEQWTDAALFGLLALLPAVMLITWYHGAPGRGHWGAPEKVGLPLNLLAATALVVLVLFYPGSLQLPTAHASIAVLPFVDLSPEGDQEYFSDGIAEELLSVLARVPAFHVAGRTSSFSFKGKNEDLREIARKLGVAHILEGSLRKSGDRVRITAQLVNAEDGFHVWSETYDRTLDDIFAVQDAIANNIVVALQEVLGSGSVPMELVSTKSTDNLGAYQSYLQGRYLWQRRGEENIRNSIDLFKHAIDLDPEFARAWSNLAASYVVLDAYSDETLAAMAPFARDAAEKAIQLDSNLAEPYGVLAFLHDQEDLEWSKGEVAYLRALELEPGNATLNGWYGMHLVQAGYLNEGYESIQKTYELDPVSGHITSWMGWIEYMRGNDDKAEEYARRALELAFPAANFTLYVLYMQQGRYEDAIAAGEIAAAETQPNPDYVRPFVETVMDPARKPEAMAALRKLEEREQDSYLFFEYAMLREIDELYRSAENALQDNVMFPLTFAWGPAASEFRQNPRFKQLAERVGLTKYWDERGAPDLCRKSGVKWECQ